MRAGWEELKILSARQPLEELIEDPDTPTDIRQKLALVAEARGYAKTIGLKPKGSFSQYSQVDRDVLVWVLSGSKKLRFEPVTWWFPIVGRVPYKGYFEKEDGLDSLRELKDDGYDVLLRPSAAFSTLGWFNDPMLSTYIKADDADLAATVFHEILHNTLWVKNHANFNESLATYVGLRSAENFFRHKSAGENAQLSSCSINKSLAYSIFLKTLIDNLTALYKEVEDQVIDSDFALEKRREYFDTAGISWGEQAAQICPPATPEAGKIQFNNAVILAHKVYHDRLGLLDRAYHDAATGSIAKFIELMKQLAKEANEDEVDPFMLLEKDYTSSSNPA
jgi:predicted aminopeptidase